MKERRRFYRTHKKCSVSGWKKKYSTPENERKKGKEENRREGREGKKWDVKECERQQRRIRKNGWKEEQNENTTNVFSFSSQVSLSSFLSILFSSSSLLSHLLLHLLSHLILPFAPMKKNTTKNTVRKKAREITKREKKEEKLGKKRTRSSISISGTSLCNIHSHDDVMECDTRTDRSIKSSFIGFWKRKSPRVLKERRFSLK